MSKFAYAKRNFPVKPPSVEAQIAEENREKREEQRSEKEIEGGKQGQKTYDDGLAAQKKVNAEKQEMSDRLKPSEAHSLIYKNRPGLYGGTIPEYKKVEEVKESASEEHEESEEEKLEEEEESEEEAEEESMKLDPAVIGYIALKVSAIVDEEAQKDAAEVYLSAEGVETDEGIEKELARVMDAIE